MKNYVTYYIEHPTGKFCVPVSSRTLFNSAHEDRWRIQDTINGCLVSTVFLGVNHRFESGRPILYETMIFSGDDSLYQERYFTRGEAISGHKMALEKAKRLSEGAF